MREPKVIAVDIETTGLDFRKDKIRLISAYSEDLELVTEDISELKEILEDPQIKKIFHNAPFDLSFLEQNGVSVKNYTDTSVIAQVVDNKARGDGRSLAFLSEEYLGIYMDKSLQNASNWDDEITKEHKAYALKDSKVTYLLYKRFMEIVEEEDLYGVLEREVAALPIIVHLKINGMKFDFEGWSKVLEEMAKETEVLRETIRGIAGDMELNLESPKQILEMLKELKIDVVATNDEELKKYEKDHEIVALLRKYKKKKKNLSAFGSKLESMIGVDGRLRGNWSLIGTDTFRMGCSNPPLQAMPRASRPHFKAEEGYSLILADYKNIELRILAAITKDAELLKAFKNGEDLHKKTASSIFEKQVDDISEVGRDVGKIINFGIIYGMSSFGIRRKVSSSIGKEITLSEAEDYRQSYFNLYKEVLEYQEAMLKACYITTFGGRFWDDNELPKGSIKRYNYPIQNAMSQGLKQSIILLLGVLEIEKRWKVVNIIHDEIIMEVPDSDIEEAKTILEDLMVKGMIAVVGDMVPIEIDINVRKSWEEA